MKKLWVIGSLAVVVALVGLMALGVTSAFAQGPTGTTPPMYGRALGLGMGGFGGPDNSMVAVAAKVLGMDQTALINELNAGKTIADVAKAKNVSVDKIVTVFVDARKQALQAAVTAKRITQAQADTTLAAIKTQAQTDVTTKMTAHTYGAGMGAGRGAGMMGQGFVDANKDGVCDNCGANHPAGVPFGPGARWNTK